MGKNPLCIRFDEIDGFIKVYDKIKGLISEKINITDKIRCNFARIRIDLRKSLPIEKILIFHNIIHIKSVVNELKTNYYTIFLENGLFKEKSNTDNFQINVCTL